VDGFWTLGGRILAYTSCRKPLGLFVERRKQMANVVETVFDAIVTDNLPTNPKK
jgi:hypothetical protein